MWGICGKLGNYRNKEIIICSRVKIKVQIVKTIMTLPFAKFIWIVELATADDWAKGQISARAVLDATASLREKWPFWLFHSRTKALIFQRNIMGADGDAKTIGSLQLSGMEKTAFSRWNRLERIKCK